MYFHGVGQKEKNVQQLAPRTDQTRISVSLCLSPPGKKEYFITSQWFCEDKYIKSCPALRYFNGDHISTLDRLAGLDK